MGTLRYSIICSADGYANDAEGDIAWSAPAAPVHAWINAQERSVTTHVLGRRMYRMLQVWDDWEASSAEEQDYAEIWAGTDKVVCSDTMDAASLGRRARLEPRLTTRRLAEIVAASDGGVSISGPTIAQEALAAGMVDEIDLIVLPTLVGDGLRAVPQGARGDLRLVDAPRFDDGTVVLQYRRA